MTILDETYTLSNGVEIPKLGLGTWFIDDDKAADAVRSAVEIGYRDIDTAQAYGNERGVGEGVRASGVPRDELLVSTKLAAEIKDDDRGYARDWGRRCHRANCMPSVVSTRSTAVAIAASASRGAKACPAWIRQRVESTGWASVLVTAVVDSWPVSGTKYAMAPV